MIQIKN